jgi:hypothetical protein
MNIAAYDLGPDGFRDQERSPRSRDLMLTVSIVGARALYYLGGRARWLGHSL